MPFLSKTTSLLSCRRLAPPSSSSTQETQKGAAGGMLPETEGWRK